MIGNHLSYFLGSQWDGSSHHVMSGVTSNRKRRGSSHAGGHLVKFPQLGAWRNNQNGHLECDYNDESWES